MSNEDLPIPMSEKTPEMKDAIEGMFPGTKAAIDANKCPSCKEPIGEFKDDLSKREYGISGLCQKCQDSVFGSDEEVDHEDEPDDHPAF